MLPHFCMRLFLDVGSEEEALLPGPLDLRILHHYTFFLRVGFIKDVVYNRKVRVVADLRQSIIEAVELITPHMLINTWQEPQYRLDICRATTGAHIEVYRHAY